MSDGHRASPLDAAAGEVGPDAAEAFALLANETRLAILLAMWEAYDPPQSENVPFSTLLERVDIADRGNLSYHLSELDGRFITQHTDRGGYELRTAGLNLIRTIIAGTGLEDAAVTDAALEESCPVCEGPRTEITYHDGVVLWRCRECEGIAPGVSMWGQLRHEMDGELGLVQFEPAGVADRTAQELRAASQVARHQKARTMFDGVCPTCSGPVDSRLEYCHDHDPHGGCEACGFLLRLLVHVRCTVCRDHDILSPKRLTLFHPRVVAFYASHDISTRIHTDDLASPRRVFDHMTSQHVEIASEDPLRVTVIPRVDGDEIRVTFDETASIIDVTR